MDGPIAAGMTDELTPEDESVAQRHDLDHLPLVDPAAKGGLVGVLKRRYLLRLMVKRELRARYIGSKMGLAWSYINPVTRFFTFYFVFGVIMARGQIPHFAIHLFAGMVLVNYFNESFGVGHPVDHAEQVGGAEDAAATGDLPDRLHARVSSTTPGRRWSC